MSRSIAQDNPTATVIGIEIARPLVRYVRRQLRRHPLANLSIIRANALDYDYSEVDVIYVYGMPKTVNRQLKNVLIPQMKSGAKFISYMFDIRDRPEGETVTYPSEQTDAQIHIYTKS
ncbi:MAG: hypothetical protein H6766_05560 [Candidatus Peribacteria bacterium]|nr:MAG: hypothetical protein H6766_05560 [Candidatus Peribacteria bacterium]